MRSTRSSLSTSRRSTVLCMFSSPRRTSSTLSSGSSSLFNLPSTPLPLLLLRRTRPFSSSSFRLLAFSTSSLQSRLTSLLFTGLRSGWFAKPTPTLSAAPPPPPSKSSVRRAKSTRTRRPLGQTAARQTRAVAGRGSSSGRRSVAETSCLWSCSSFPFYRCPLFIRFRCAVVDSFLHMCVPVSRAVLNRSVLSRSAPLSGFFEIFRSCSFPPLLSVVS